MTIEDLSLEKQRLQDVMSGESARQKALEEAQSTRELMTPDLPVNEDLNEVKMCTCFFRRLMETVIKEIQDRRQWLDDMISLGRGDKFKNQIQTEISLVCVNHQTQHLIHNRESVACGN